MGGSVSCCISPGESPKIHRREVELEECPITTTEDVSEDTGTYLQHISDRELPDGGLRRTPECLPYVNRLLCTSLLYSWRTT